MTCVQEAFFAGLGLSSPAHLCTAETVRAVSLCLITASLVYLVVVYALALTCGEWKDGQAEQTAHAAVEESASAGAERLLHSPFVD